MALQDPVQQSGVVGVLGEFGEFESITGGIPTTEYSTHFEAGAREPDQLPGTTTYTDIVLVRAYRSDRDAALVAWHDKFRQGLEVPRTVTKQIRNYAGLVTRTETYVQCKPVSVETPEGKSGDNSVANVTVTLKVTRKL